MHQAKVKVHPFLNSPLAPPKNYNGEFFQLNHNYPTNDAKPVQPYPWKKVTQSGHITQSNALAYVYTLYDARAAKTLGNIWGNTEESAMNPIINRQTSQYEEGSVIVKFSFVTTCSADWSPMTKTATWQIYAPIIANNGTAHSANSTCQSRGTEGNAASPAITNVYLMQFDIIVKV